MMTEDFDESNLLEYQGYDEDETKDFKEKNKEDEIKDFKKEGDDEDDDEDDDEEDDEEHDSDDESIDDESSEVGWNSEDEKKYYTKNIDKLNESYIIHEETEEELKDDELDVEIVHEEKNDELDVEMVHEEKDDELDVEMVHEEKNDELHIEIVDEEQHAWYYGEKEELKNIIETIDETIDEKINHLYESFIPEEKPLVDKEINDEETKLHNKKSFCVIIWDFINNLFKLFSK